jgi:gas vesicle protein GvpN
MDSGEEIAVIKRTYGIVGRERELELALAAVRSGRHLMIEGPVGVGKTILAIAVARHLGRTVLRVDGDERYTEQKLSGWFDPPVVLEKGYVDEAFIAGPLTEAMRAGGVLFINEMNRMPEGVQNILLPAMDEGLIEIPKVGTVKATPGFVVIATQNPREFVATTALSEALSDRFEMVLLHYQPEIEEMEILRRQMKDVSEEVIARSVWIARRTRDHPNIKRGASIRAAMGIAQLAKRFTGELHDGIRKAALMALPTRIEMREESKLTPEEVIEEIVSECFSLSPPSSGRPLEDPKRDEEMKRRAEEDVRYKRINVSGILEVLEQGGIDEVSDHDDLGWTIAQNYSYLRTRVSSPAMLELAKRIAIRATIRRVLQLLGPVSVPTHLDRTEFRMGMEGELDVEETLDRIAEIGRKEPSAIVLERREPRRMAVALMLDASLSMSGDKLAIATAAIAVLAFRLKTVDYLLITFNDVPKVVKRVDQTRSLDDLVSMLLDFNAIGYTNIDGALRKGKEELSRSRTRNQVGILVTDGNYTVGEDPVSAAGAYKRLFVVMTEGHDCQPQTCEGIAKSGGGAMYAVSDFDEIPRVLYRVLRLVAQGSPHSVHR